MARKARGTAKPIIGVWVTTPNPWACEIARAAGFDAVVLDGEHGTMGPETLDGLVALARSLGLSVLVRVGMADRLPIQQALDAGAHGLILPQIAGLEHARRAAGFAKYPPLGLRGMGSPRSLGHGATPDDFVAAENRRTHCFVMIETPGALADADAIAALPTVDGLAMGPYDLSLTRGRGQYRATAADEMDARAIVAAARTRGKLVIMPAGDDRALERAREFGAAIVTLGEDLGALADGLGRMRARAETLAR
jgi:2-dehydro-3-deoxyglucarate aldolase/4-hydroxy-2-oxoheptanedioate aldolase